MGKLIKQTWMNHTGRSLCRCLAPLPMPTQPTNLTPPSPTPTHEESHALPPWEAKFITHEHTHEYPQASSLLTLNQTVEPRRVSHQKSAPRPRSQAKRATLGQVHQAALLHHMRARCNFVNKRCFTMLNAAEKITPLLAQRLESHD